MFSPASRTCACARIPTTGASACAPADVRHACSVHNSTCAPTAAFLARLRADLFEGSVIRATRRLDELMQQLARAAKVVGDEGLAAKIEESNMTIRRDIIFAASLYV